jgi:uncharacterized Tic20 family protein
MRNTTIITLALLLYLSSGDPALAYVGPGAGLSLLSALWGLLLAIGAAIGFIILWPLRRVFKRYREKKTEE